MDNKTTPQQPLTPQQRAFKELVDKRDLILPLIKTEAFQSILKYFQVSREQCKEMLVYAYKSQDSDQSDKLRGMIIALDDVLRLEMQLTKEGA